MSKKSNKQIVSEEISGMVSLMKTITSNNLVEQSQQLNLDRQKLMQIVNIVESSITQAFVNSIEGITNQISNGNE